MVDDDLHRYQTVYAQKLGAVAAPTAGLHFTEEMLDNLKRKGVRQTFLTLHVGEGTFKPIQTDDLSQHNMHYEYGEISQETTTLVEETKRKGGKVVAIGTTSVRVLETAAQNTPDEAEGLQPWKGETNLFIRPPYKFKAVDALLTNFHLPKSTLLVLVRAFGGDELIQEAYREAIEEEYRFYSYGDAMLIL